MNGETCDRSRASRSPHRVPRPARHAEWQTRADDAAAPPRSQDHDGSAAPEIPTATPTPSRTQPPCARTPRARPPGHPHAPRRARDAPASARDDPPAVPAPAPATARPGPRPPSHPAPGSPHGESPRPSPASSNTRAAGAPSRTTATPPSAPPPAAAPARRALPPGSTPPATAGAPSHAQSPAARPPAAGPTRIRTRTTMPPPPDSGSMHSPEPARRDARETPAPPPVTGRAGSSALPPRHDRWATSRHPTGYTGVHKGDRKSTRLNSSHVSISYAVFCLKKKKLNAAADLRAQASRDVSADERALGRGGNVDRLEVGLRDQVLVILPRHAFFFNDTATTEIYTLSLHDALPI